MGDVVENDFGRQNCNVCGADATPLSADPLAQQLIAHIRDYNDPHRTLQLIPQVYYGASAPVPGDGYSTGDWYIDTTNTRAYSYRKISEDPDTYEWVPASASVEASLASYVYVDPLVVGGVAQETNLTNILQSYLKTAEAKAIYASKTEVSALTSKVNGISLENVVTRNGANASRDIDIILRDYLKTSDLASRLTGKQNKLTAGANITINQSTNVISAKVPAVSVATATVDGLMSAADKSFLDSVSGLLGTKQDKLTAANAGANVQISDGVISASVGLATSTSSGLMSSSDKVKLDQLPSGGISYTLPVASEAALGGVRVTGNVVDREVTSGSSGGYKYVAPPGMTPCKVGNFSGIIYSEDPPVATSSTYGTVKTGDSVSSESADYAPCCIDENGVIRYGTALRAVASGSTLGGIKVDSTPLGDTDGYLKLKVDATGTAYYSPSTVDTATSAVAGVVKVDSTTVGIANIGSSSILGANGWVKVRCDSDGYAYFNHGVASSSAFGHVKVDSTILTDTDDYQKCRIDGNGYLYYAKPETIIPKATSLDPGVVMVDSTTVDATSPSPYVKCRVDANGTIYSKGYDDAIATLQYQGAGHDVLHTPALTARTITSGNVVSSFDCTLMNNAMNYIAAAGTSDYDIYLKFPARLNPRTNARDFFVVIKFPGTWSSTRKLTLRNDGSATQGESIVVLGDPDYGSVIQGDLADCITMLYFTEVVSGTFVVSRKTVTEIM